MALARNIFNKSIAIIDELSDSGAVNEAQVKEYMARAPYLLDMWQREIARLENTEITEEIISLDQEVQISDQNCPSGAYYLAMHFALADQNTELANLCQAKYEVLKREARRPMPSKDITDIYCLNQRPY